MDAAPGKSNLLSFAQAQQRLADRRAKRYQNGSIWSEIL
jgi:hypothetical protein